MTLYTNIKKAKTFYKFQPYLLLFYKLFRKFALNVIFTT